MWHTPFYFIRIQERADNVLFENSDAFSVKYMLIS